MYSICYPLPKCYLVATQIQSDSNTELGGVLTGACKNSVASLLVVQLRVLYETSLGVKATHLLLRIVLPCEAFAEKLRKPPGMSRMHFWQHGCQQTLSGKVAMKQKWSFHENMENLSMSMESCIMGSSWTIKYPWQLFFFVLILWIGKLITLLFLSVLLWNSNVVDNS